MLKLDNLKPAPGSKHRKKLLGRGEGSGHGGKGSTRGGKGQTARSGDRALRPGFEGGQMPLMRRIPKRGFSNRAFRTEYAIVNVDQLEAFFEPGTEVTPQTLRERGILRGKHPVKILGTGEIKKALKVRAERFSKSAAEKIKKAGGTAEPILQERKEKPKSEKTS